MFLEKLTVISKSEIIREIQFHDGVNLIVDISKNPTEETGNSVGKTTVLRVIDYCLGSDGKDIYFDSEFNKMNDLVFNYLNNSRVTFKLILRTLSNKYIVIDRGFPNNAVMSINNVNYKTETDFRRNLEAVIFKSTETKPSLRQLMSKFIRKDAISMSNTVKFLHQSISASVYEILFLFLFGFKDQKILKERFDLTEKIKKLKAKLKAVEGKNTLAFYNQLLLRTDNEIAVFEKKIKDFELNETYDEDIKELTRLTNVLSENHVKEANINSQIELNSKSLEELRNNKSNIDPKSIKYLYDEAKMFIPNLQVKFEELLTFHNKMISEKIYFIETNLEELKKQLHAIKYDIRELNKSKSEIYKILTSKGSFADLQRLQKQLNDLYGKKGGFTERIKLIIETKEEIKSNEEELEIVDAKISNYYNDFQNKVASFNTYFSKYSELFYGDEYIFSYESKKGFQIDNVKMNVGTGEKIAQIAAFDLAYISFIEKQKLPYPRFILHNNIEQVDNNQLKSLFDIANTLNGQYVVPVLRNRLMFLGEEFIEKYQIIELSQFDKFFRIPEEITYQ